MLIHCTLARIATEKVSLPIPTLAKMQVQDDFIRCGRIVRGKNQTTYAGCVDYLQNALHYQLQGQLPSLAQLLLQFIVAIRPFEGKPLSNLQYKLHPVP